jgi:hypothetical protein
VLGGQAALSQPGGAETPNPQNQMRFDSIDSQRNSTLFSTVRSVHIRSGRAADTDPDADGAPRMPRREETVVSAMLGWARRQIGHQVTDKGATTSGAQPIASREWVETTRADMAMNSVSQSPLGNPDQLAAEERANKIVASPVVKLAELVLKMAWLATASRQYARVGGPDAANLAQIDKAVHEYAVMAALEQQSLDPNNPT